MDSSKTDNIDSLCEEVNFRKVYSERFEQVRNFIYYKCGKLEDATDITQEALMRMWEKCSEVIPGKEINYLFTVANRIFLNQLRSTKIHLKFERAQTRSSDNMSPEYLMLENEFKERLESVLDEMPEDQRVIFLQSRIDDMKYAEIAEFHGISIKTVEAKMGRALRHLKENVEDLNKYKI